MQPLPKIYISHQYLEDLHWFEDLLNYYFLGWKSKPPFSVLIWSLDSYHNLWPKNLSSLLSRVVTILSKLYCHSFIYFFHLRLKSYAIDSTLQQLNVNGGILDFVWEFSITMTRQQRNWLTISIAILTNYMRIPFMRLFWLFWHRYVSCSSHFKNQSWIYYFFSPIFCLFFTTK